MIQILILHKKAFSEMLSCKPVACSKTHNQGEFKYSHLIFPSFDI